MSKYRVAHYISKYLSIPENWIYKILINLRKYEPIMLTRWKENVGMYPTPHLFSLDDFSKPRQFNEILFYKIFGFFLFFKNRCKQFQVNLLHVHFGYHGVKMIGLKETLNVPMVCSFYGDDAFAYPTDAHNLREYQTLFKKANKILVLGPYMRSTLITLGCDQSKLLIHHLGIEVNKIEFRPRKLNGGEQIRFLIASSFVEKKGIDVAIHALGDLKSSYNFSLDIVGDGVLKKEVLAAIEQSGMEDRTVLHGYQSYSFFIQKSLDCHVLIQASRTGRKNNKEGTPMAIVDAMATGMAIVSTNHSDIPEIVVDGENGYLASENDLESLKECLRKVLDAPEKIHEFGVNGRRKVELEFNATIQVKRLEEIYDEVLQESK